MRPVIAYLVGSFVYFALNMSASYYLFPLIPEDWRLVVLGVITIFVSMFLGVIVGLAILGKSFWRD